MSKIVESREIIKNLINLIWKVTEKKVVTVTFNSQLHLATIFLDNGINTTLNLEVPKDTDDNQNVKNAMDLKKNFVTFVFVLYAKKGDRGHILLCNGFCSKGFHTSKEYGSTYDDEVVNDKQSIHQTIGNPSEEDKNISEEQVKGKQKELFESNSDSDDVEKAYNKKKRLSCDPTNLQEMFLQHIDFNKVLTPVSLESSLPNHLQSVEDCHEYEISTKLYHCLKTKGLILHVDSNKNN
ncbi:5072_t:CDS:2 [Cetraspora pellucida]|uniref:5072_t:CDS:1 n=1 Tax=Cetraspora pellucida TaxID=1433469 RepID=A0A9N9B3C9_9GLOM|nr:5072_t:CDS:2 [Cetraspora pellucida]